jgi:hypothetical protein
MDCTPTPEPMSDNDAAKIEQRAKRLDIAPEALADIEHRVEQLLDDLWRWGDERGYWWMDWYLVLMERCEQDWKRLRERSKQQPDAFCTLDGEPVEGLPFFPGQPKEAWGTREGCSEEDW